MFKKPFDDLNNLTKAIGMYKGGCSLEKVRNELGVSSRQLRFVFSLFGVKVRKAGSPFSKIKKVAEEEKKVNHKIHKYDQKFSEPINPGKSYSEYCKQYGIKVKKSWFGRKTPRISTGD